MFEKEIGGEEGRLRSVGVEEGGLVVALRGSSDEKRKLRIRSQPSRDYAVSWVPRLPENGCLQRMNYFDYMKYTRTRCKLEPMHALNALRNVALDAEMSVTERLWVSVTEEKEPMPKGRGIKKKRLCFAAVI